MPLPYQVWLRQPCYEYIARLKGKERAALIARLESLTNNFSQLSDHSVRGEDGRDWQISVVGPHAVVWWVDHPAAEVKIVAIRRADD